MTAVLDIPAPTREMNPAPVVPDPFDTMMEIGEYLPAGEFAAALAASDMPTAGVERPCAPETAAAWVAASWLRLGEARLWWADYRTRQLTAAATLAPLCEQDEAEYRRIWHSHHRRATALRVVEDFYAATGIQPPAPEWTTLHAPPVALRLPLRDLDFLTEWTRIDDNGALYLVPIVVDAFGNTDPA